MAPIHTAAGRCDVEALRRLLAEGVPPSAANDEDRGRTPLHYLFLTRPVQGDPAACFKLLRDAGANLDAVSRGDYTALHYAASFANVEIVTLLVEAGANVNAVTAVGWNPLHFAALRTVDCVEVLLAAGASVNARDGISGGTPFDLALNQNRRRAWPLFLRRGAEIPTDCTEPYIVRVRNAGGFKKYEQAHITRITAILAPTPRLPPEMVRKIVEFWLHAGYY